MFECKIIYGIADYYCISKANELLFCTTIRNRRGTMKWVWLQELMVLSVFFLLHSVYLLFWWSQFAIHHLSNLTQTFHFEISWTSLLAEWLPQNYLLLFYGNFPPKFRAPRIIGGRNSHFSFLLLYSIFYGSV